MEKKKPAKTITVAHQPVAGSRELAQLKAWLPLIVLFVAALWYSSFKVGLMHCNPGFTPTQDQGMFWSETAYQYRYAKMFAENDARVWQLLKRDTQLQYPEGVDTWRDYTTFMEPFDGLFYRFLVPKAIPFHVFLVWFVALFSSLLAFVIYGVCRTIWKERLLALAAALSWMLIPASFMRQVSAIYLKEDFSLLFVVAFMLLFVVGLEDRRRRIPILGGLALFVALASWHLSQFFFLLLMGCTAFLFVTGREWEKHWTRNLAVYLGFALAAACLPVLRQRAFIVSQGMLLCYALFAAIFIRQKLARKSMPGFWARTGIVAGAFLLLALVDLPFAGRFKEYAHVFELFIYKVRYLGVMPSDPRVLPFEARVFWAGDFNGVSYDKLIGAYKWYAPLIPVVFLVFALGALTKKLPRQEQFLGVLLLGALFIYWLVDRLSIFFAPLFAVSLCVLLSVAVRLSRPAKAGRTGRPARIDPVHVAVYSLLALVAAADFFIVSRLKPVIDEVASNKTELFDWIRANTAPGDPFVGNFSDGPMILLYTGRPTILNSQYENSFIRRKTVEFYKAYFGSEADLYAFCAKYGARYVEARATAAIDTKPGGDRWSAAMPGPLPAHCAAALIQFAPQTMTRFAPVFDNPQYRIVKVLQPGERIPPWKRGFYSSFDPSLFERQGDFYVNTDAALERISAAGAQLRDAGPLFSQMVQAFQSSAVDRGRQLAELAREKLRKAEAFDPKDYMIYSNWALLEAQAGNMPVAVDKAAQALAIVPSDRLLQRMFFDFAGTIANWELAEIAGKKLLADPANAPNRPFLNQQIARAALERKEYAPAEGYADSALAHAAPAESTGCNPALLYYIKAAAAFRSGNANQAQADLSKCGSANPDPEVQRLVQVLVAESGRRK